MIKIKQWKEYYEEMLNEDRDKYKQEERHSERREEHVISSITKNEIYDALKRCKNGKSPGPGNIPIELKKCGPEIVIEQLQRLFNKCLMDKQKVPDEWRLEQISSIHKKGSRQQCNNYRGITVTSSVGRLYGRIIKTRNEDEIEIEEEQAGFIAGKSCVDNIFTLRQLIHKRSARDLETHLVFVDLEKAYDSVPHKKLFEVLHKSYRSIDIQLRI